MALQNTINLKEFNKTSAKHGRFPVTIFRGQVQKYTYEAKPTKKKVEAIKFECTLVGQDAGYYMKAFLRGTEKQVQTVSDKLKDGSKWILSKPALDSWTKPAYISKPIQFRINLASTELKVQCKTCLLPHFRQEPLQKQSVSIQTEVKTFFAL